MIFDGVVGAATQQSAYSTWLQQSRSSKISGLLTPSWQLLGDVRPLVAILGMCLQDDFIFFRGPWSLADAGVQMVMPAADSTTVSRTPPTATVPTAHDTASRFGRAGRRRSWTTYTVRAAGRARRRLGPPAHSQSIKRCTLDEKLQAFKRQHAGALRRREHTSADHCRLDALGLGLAEGML